MEAEVAELAARLVKEWLLLIVGDSGSELHRAVNHAALTLGRSPTEAAEFARLVKDPDPDTAPDETGISTNGRRDPEAWRALLSSA